MDFQSPAQAELVKHAVYREIYRLRCMISGLSDEASDRKRLEPQIEQLEVFYESCDDSLDRAWKAEGRCVELRRLIDRLCLAADAYGVSYLDSDDMSPEAEELSEATQAARAFLQKDSQS